MSAARLKALEEVRAAARRKRAAEEAARRETEGLLHRMGALVPRRKAGKWYVTHNYRVRQQLAFCELWLIKSFRRRWEGTYILNSIFSNILAHFATGL